LNFNGATAFQPWISNPTSVKISKEAYVKVFDVIFMDDINVYELVDAIILHTNWERKQDELLKLIEIIEKRRRSPRMRMTESPYPVQYDLPYNTEESESPYNPVSLPYPARIIVASKSYGPVFLPYPPVCFPYSRAASEDRNYTGPYSPVSIKGADI